VTQAEQQSLISKNHELVKAFREKSQTHQQLQKAYQILKAQAMTSQVEMAASDDAEHFLQTTGAKRFVDRMSTGGAASRYPPSRPEMERIHSHQKSGGSGSSGGQRIGDVWDDQRYDNRASTARKWELQSRRSTF